MADHKIHLDVRSTAGSWQHPFPPTDTVQNVLDAGVSHFHLEGGSGSYFLAAADGTVMPLDATLSGLGLQDGSLVVIKARQPQDG